MRHSEHFKIITFPGGPFPFRQRRKWYGTVCFWPITKCVMRHNDKCWVHVITHSTVAKGEQMKVICNKFNWTEETQTCRRLMLCMWSLLKTNTYLILRKSSYRTYILLIYVWLYFIWSTIFKSNLFYFLNNHCKETHFLDCNWGSWKSSLCRNRLFCARFNILHCSMWW